MRISKMMACAAFAGTLFLPGLAAAANAFTTGDVNMRAGPNTGFPRVATLPQGVTVTVHGCLRQWSWCDTSWRGRRGWVSGRYLEQIYRGRRVLVPEYGRSLGLPIISFQIGSYWDRWYSDSSWYRERPRWQRRWDRGDWSRVDDDGPRRRGDEDGRPRGRDADDDARLRRGESGDDRDEPRRRVRGEEPDNFDRQFRQEDSMDEQGSRARRGDQRGGEGMRRDEGDDDRDEPRRAQRRGSSETVPPGIRRRGGDDCPPGLRRQGRCD